ncbi:uncharacterized protein BYT42DRAFT_576691 [Radiomyces spectabilis]|uniref:uncharacterized protein n=1 Tax=Radiomyces spectabilis TaxID=64574 RepID=UPI002220A4D0|nr:uncharacterized protein BYT42DRAFT_576691 [Radiomyces spectabilis]KAI8374533.1 hypothetical protein BYT42DRAFT_576691 [Radiomyces spectabilis]
MSLTKADPNKQGWEDSEFPIVCETCLGDNPYVRMTKQPYGKECKICQRPFTVFRWLPGTNMRYKKTEICQTCAKLKNVCQTCVLDLQYGLPVQVRDEALNVKSEAPTSNINRQYYAQNMANKVDDDVGGSPYESGKSAPASREILRKLARTEPYYKRNRPHICSFFVKGECTRGDECPYRHEMPGESDLQQQNIRDRYYGNNDPVAQKMLGRVKGTTQSLAPPEDKSVTSLFVTGIEEDIVEQDIRGYFHMFGDIKSVIVIHKSKCAFVNFVTRTAAEMAADRIADTGLTLKGHNLRVAWGRPRPQGPKSDMKRATATGDLGAMQPPAPPSMKATGSTVKYPSQDPTSQGSVTKST